jgi:CBS domain-containing protein
MSHLKTLLTPRPVTLLPPYASISEAVETMSNKHIGSILITESGKVVGIFTERDLMKKVIAQKLDPKNTELGSVMTKNPECATLNNTVHECYELMNKLGCRHLPVIDEDKPIAVISIRDVLSWTIDQLAYERDQLKNYVST